MTENVFEEGLEIVEYNSDISNEYFSHLAYTINTTTKVANQIANSPELMIELLKLNSTDEDAKSASEVIKILADNVDGLGEAKSKRLVDAYLETPYKEPNTELKRAIAEVINTYPAESEQVQWLLTKPNKFSKSPQEIIEKEVGGREGFWDAYLEHRIPYKIALRGYWLLSKDDDERKTDITQMFTAYQTLDEQETQNNQPFLNAPEDGFNSDIMKEFNIMKHTDLGWIKTSTFNSIRMLYKLMIEAKNESDDTMDDDLYQMFLDDGLYEDQANAAVKIVNNKVSFLTGYAGTGKSFMLNKALSYLKSEYEKQGLGDDLFYMTAISGRAVKNFMNGVDSSLRVTGATMAASIFVQARKKQLSLAKVLLIDEVSMADLNNVTRTINMAKNVDKIIFIGDVAQLPAIQLDWYTKAVNDGVTNPVTLTIPKRQDMESGILEDSLSIRDGNMPKFNKSDSVLGHANSVEEIVYQNNDADIFLTGTNASAKVINDIKAKQYLDKADKKNKAYVERVLYGDGTRFLVTKNNPQTGLMNGDIITLVVKNNVHHFKTDNGIELEDVDVRKHGLRLGFAITVHKSQGSTIDNVVTILDSYNMATRPLLYTAISRASKKHVLYEMKDDILSSALRKGVDYQEYDYKQVLSMTNAGKSMDYVREGKNK